MTTQFEGDEQLDEATSRLGINDQRRGRVGFEWRQRGWLEIRSLPEVRDDRAEHCELSRRRAIVDRDAAEQRSCAGIDDVFRYERWHCVHLR
jgi:hypothetical protein